MPEVPQLVSEKRVRDKEAEACPSGKFRPDSYDDGRNDACNEISEAIRTRIEAREVR